MGLILLLTLTVSAQEDEEVPQVEITGGYSYLHSEGHGLNGWKAGVVANVNQVWHRG